ncbi:ABC transporter ATP-binding protein [Paenibacillus sp. BT-177]|uniref:ABC transporter ATP-binding protein n=1 Tax=Paenibacillus sp. BT-177 TaxID=2986930 RepID=UPI0021F7F671|nr:ABC transporter ATP-binding protein/permease [Paenibacillus sp. BT-177]
MTLFLFKYKYRFFVVIFMISLASLLDIYLAFIFKSLIDTATSQGEKQFIETSLIAIGFIIINSLVKMFSNLSQSSYLCKTVLFLKEIVFQHILYKDHSQFTSNHSAKYISIMNNDIKMIEDDYLKNIFSLTSTGVSFLAALFAMFVLSPSIVVILLLLTLISILIPRIFEKKIRTRKRNIADALEKFTIKINDIFSGFAVIKSYGVEQHVEQQFRFNNTVVENNKYLFFKLNAYVSSLSDVFGGVMFISVFLVGSFLSIRGAITLGTMIACVQLTNKVVNPVYMSIQYITQIRALRDISAKILEILHEDQDGNQYIKKTSIEHSVRFTNVSFGYARNHPNLHDINMVLNKGGKYALVGPSGSGKSTLLKLLMKQYDDYDGIIYVDDLDLKFISAEDWCRLESVVQQDVFLFDSSIKENITMYQSFQDEILSNVISASGLNKLIDKLPYGLDTQIGEKGGRLSGGEKQRIAIARTLIRQTPLLLLDEATSSLDSETANAIEEVILGLETITCLVVTHRLSKAALQQYDKIFVMSDGRVVEEGSFDYLIENKGYFYHLYKFVNDSSINQTQPIYT